MVDLTPEEKEKDTKPPREDLPRIRTYAADLSEEIRERGTTLSSIISSEKAARRPNAVDPEPGGGRRSLIVAVIAVVLVVIGLASVVAAFLFRDDSASPIISESIIFANKSTLIDAAVGPVALALTNHRTKDPLSLGEIEQVVVVNGLMPLAPADIARALGAPEALIREVTDTMVGIHAFDHTQPFIIFKVTAYDRAFNAMLVWEPDMARSLGDFFAPVGRSVPAGAPTLVFTDAIVKNLDVRQSLPAQTDSNSWPLMYTFPTQHLLIITTNEFTLREVVSRLGTAR